MRQLYKVAKEFSKENEHEFMKAWVEDPGSLEKMLLKHDIVPIQTIHNKNLTSFVGKGAYSRVFEVLYKGKRAAAKVTGSIPDYSSVIKLWELRDSLPEEFKKYIMKVYDHFKDGDFYVIVTEYLNKLPSNYRSELFGAGYAYYAEDRRSGFLDSDDNIMNIASRSVKIFESEFGHDVFTLSDMAVSNYMLKNRDKLKSHFIDYNIGEEFMAYVFEILVKNGIDKRVANRISEIAVMNIRGILDDVTNGNVFPRHHSQRERVDLVKSKGDRQINDFVAFLEYLKRSHDILWRDLHEDNIMQRSNGDLVISDPGLFVFGNDI